MADFVELDSGSGGAKVYVDELTVATSTLAAQRVKILLGADGVNDGDVNSSNPLPVTIYGTLTTQPINGTVTANIGTVSSLATDASLLAISSLTLSTNTLLVQVSTTTASSNALLSTQTLRLNNISTFTKSTADMTGSVLSSNTFRMTLAASDVALGGGTQYIEGATSTAPTGTVMLWKSAVSTMSAVTTSNTLPVNVGNISTFTNSTNTLLIQVSSNTASTNALLSTQTLRLNNISTFTKSTADLLGGALAASTGALWVQSIPGSAQSTISATVAINTAIVDGSGTQITSFGGGTQYVQNNTTTLPTGTIMMWKSAVSTISPVTTSLGLPVNVIAGSLSANTQYVEGNTTTAATGITMLWKSAVSTLTAVTTSNTLPVNVGNISTFTASTNTLLITVSSLTASSNALVSTQGVVLGNISTFTNSTVSLASTIAARLLQVPTGIYVQPVAVSSNGLTPYMTLDANSVIKQISASAATIYGIYFGNLSSSVAYLKIWDGVSSATFVSSTVATMCLPIPANSTNVLAGNFNAGNGLGIKMSTGICIAGVAGANNGNSTVIGTSSLVVNVFYKA
jgi:perilipin-4